MTDAYKLFKSLSVKQKYVFNLIQKNGAMTKNEILHSTNMKLTTLNRVMEPLQKNKIVIQKSMGESHGGRKPVLYDVNICRFYVVGVEVSRHYVQVSILNLRMEIFYKKFFKIDDYSSPREIAGKVKYIMDRAYIELNFQFLDLIGVCVGLETGMWDGVEAKKIFENELKCDVIVENGANCAIIAENLYGDGRKFENIAYFNCGQRIRHGLILKGMLVRPIENNEFAFEQMMISKSKFDEIPAFDRNPEDIISKFALEFSEELRSYINILNLNCVIIAGPMANSEMFCKTCLKNMPGYVELKRIGRFHEDTISLGAASIVLEQCIDNKI